MMIILLVSYYWLRDKFSSASLSIVLTIIGRIGANGICHLLKREIGAIPMLSRNCKWGVYTACHCSETMGRRIDDEPKPGYLPVCIFWLRTTRMGIVMKVMIPLFHYATLLATRGFFYALPTTLVVKKSLISFYILTAKEKRTWRNGKVYGWWWSLPWSLF